MPNISIAHEPGGGGGLLERSRQLEALSTALSEVRASGQGQLVLVAGEAGIGKTALLRGFLDGLSEPVRVLWAACDPLNIPCPLGPLLDLDAVVVDQPAGVMRAYDMASVLLRELRRRGPTVMVIEDLHWSDEATLDVIRLMAPRLSSAPVLLVLSYRDDELPRAHALQVVLGDLSGRASFRRVVPERLSQEAVAALAVPLGVDPEPLYERTAGNPFFVTEVLAAGDGRVPRTVRDAVLARCGRLGGPARRLLDATAVVPGRAEVWLLEALAPEAVGALEECLDAGVLVADDRSVAFRHDLARLVVEESTPPDQRLQLHRGALEALAQPVVGPVDLARLSYHAEAAMDATAVLRFAPAAAERAAAAGAHRQARAEYSRALRFAEHAAPADRAGLLQAFAREAYTTGAVEQAATALFEALGIRRESGDTRAQGECLRLLAEALGALGRHGDAASAGREAITVLERLPADAGLARAYATLSGVLGLADDDEGLRLGLIASSLAEEIGDTGTLIHVLNNVGCIELRRGRPEGLDKLERSRRLAVTAGDEVAVGRAYMNTAVFLVHGRDCVTAERYLRSGIDYCFEHGFEGWHLALTALEAEWALASGRWPDAERIGTAVLERAPRAGSYFRCVALLLLATLRARRGDDAVWPLLDEATELTKTAPATNLAIAVAVARAEVAWLENLLPPDNPESADLLRDVSATWQPWYAGQLVSWRRRSGLPTEAPDGLPEPYRSQIRGDHSHAARWWAEHACPYDAALALYDSGDPAALRRAHDELRRLGARPAAAIVARRLREIGERHLPRGPRPATSANPAGLTAREVEVLTLLGAGLSNKDIAASLVVSVRTVDHHVAAILRKLEVGDRAQAGAMARQLGIRPK